MRRASREISQFSPYPAANTVGSPKLARKTMKTHIKFTNPITNAAVM